MKINKIFTSEPFISDLDEVIPYLNDIWSSKIFTHNGPYVRKFEEELKQF